MYIYVYICIYIYIYIYIEEERERKIDSTIAFRARRKQLQLLCGLLSGHQDLDCLVFAIFAGEDLHSKPKADWQGDRGGHLALLAV